MHSPIDRRHRRTNACRHIVSGVVDPRFSGVAICQFEGRQDFFLFYCDEEWNHITDTWHMTLSEAMRQAEFEYEHISDTWQQTSE
jgi:hypothetical protein